MERLKIVWLSVGMFVAACGGHGPSDPTPTSAALQIACPADVIIRSVPTPAQSVTFDAPSVTGGIAPVQTSCNPTPGSNFPLGTTPVNCASSDSASQTATCSFQVTLTGFTLALKKYGAFGDSLTAGETGRPSVVGFNEVDLPNAYPTKLQERFDATYPTQGITVVNRGRSLDTAAQTDSRIRFFAIGDQPDVILLLTGYNNLNQGCGANGADAQSCRDAIRSVGGGLRDCIRHAREVDSALKFIFVSTLTPPGPTGSNRIDPRAIVQANDQIRQVVSAERAVLVDSYAAFLGREADYINVDGLHLKPAGYQALADGFFTAIQAAVPQAPVLR